MLIMIEGLKFCPCFPTFVDLRDAMFTAARSTFDQKTYRYIYCEMWKGFAKRGLGLNADGGDFNSVIDQIESFDVPGTVFLLNYSIPLFLSARK